MEPPDPGSETVIGCFLDRAARQGPSPIWYQEVEGRWAPVTWEMARSEVLRLAAGLAALGIGRGDRVGLAGGNRPGWVVADYALQLIGAVVVPLYTNSPPDQIAQMMSQTGAAVCLVDSDELIGRLREAAVPGLKALIGLHLGDVRNEQVMGRGSVERSGEAWLKENPGGLAERLGTLGPDSVATVIFTSGTDGAPKGAVLTHRNLTWAAAAAARVVGVRRREVTLSFLPLAHSFERVVTTVVPLVADTEHWTCWFVDDINRLPAAIRSVRPTIFVAVPLVWTRMENRIQSELGNSGLARRSMVSLSMTAGESAVRHRDDREPLSPGARLAAGATRMIGRRIRKKVGLGRCWFAVSGAAPLQPRTQRFFQALGVPLHQGWGLTETAALCTVQRPEDLEVGVVGSPLDGVEIKLGENDEVLVRGPNIFIGYESDPDRTAAVLDREGFFHTGDVGRLTADGRLEIVDRIKDVIITSGGRKISPRRIEERLRADPLIAGVIVIGEGRSYLTALISIEGAEAVKLIKVPGDTEIWEHPKVRERVAATVANVNRSLPEPEQLRRFEVVPFGFPDEALTPTLKLKRRVIEETFSTMIEGLYA